MGFIRKFLFLSVYSSLFVFLVSPCVEASQQQKSIFNGPALSQGQQLDFRDPHVQLMIGLSLLQEAGQSPDSGDLKKALVNYAFNWIRKSAYQGTPISMVLYAELLHKKYPSTHRASYVQPETWVVLANYFEPGIGDDLLDKLKAMRPDLVTGDEGMAKLILPKIKKEGPINDLKIYFTENSLALLKEMPDFDKPAPGYYEYRLGDLLTRGGFIRSDAKSAKHWLNKANRLGYIKAKERSKLIADVRLDIELIPNLKIPRATGLAWEDGALFVATNTKQPGIFKVDPDTGTVLDRYSQSVVVDNFFGGLAPGGEDDKGYLYHLRSGRYGVVDKIKASQINFEKEGKIRSSKIDISDIALLRGNIYTIGCGTEGVCKLYKGQSDGSGLSANYLIDFKGEPSGASSFGMTIDKDEFLWISFGNKLACVSTVDFKVLDVYDLPFEQVVALASDDVSLYAASSQGEIFKISFNDNDTRLGKLEKAPFGIVIDDSLPAIVKDSIQVNIALRKAIVLYKKGKFIPSGFGDPGDYLDDLVHSGLMTHKLESVPEAEWKLKAYVDGVAGKTIYYLDITCGSDLCQEAAEQMDRHVDSDDASGDEQNRGKVQWAFGSGDE